MPRAPAAPPPPHGDSPSPEALAFDRFVLDLRGQRLLRDGRPVALAPRPLALLVQLASNPGRLMTKDALLDAVWGHRHVSDSVLKVAVNTLRAALGDDSGSPRYIETAPRRGYRFAGAIHARTPGPDEHRTPPPPPAAAAGNLPASPHPLIGREAELAALHRMLTTHRLVTLAGPSGVGKTSLALAAASHTAPPDGTWVVRLDALADAAPLAATVAGALALSPGAGRDADALALALSPLALRLVLDNAEHLADAVAALVSACLAAAPGLQVLVTSQVPLRVAGEQVLPLAPLSLPADDGTDADPASYAAGALFLARVRARQPAFDLAAGDAWEIAQICRLLDGLPLALELAAVRVAGLGLAGVRQRMSDRFALLSRGARDAPQRHRTLRAALEWSFELLDADAQRVLLGVSVFAGGFTSELAQQLLTGPDGSPWAVLDALDDLRERSLLTVEPGQGAPRWRLLHSVRAMAAQRLEDAGQATRLRTRHAHVMLGLFGPLDELTATQPRHHWLTPLRPEADNLRAAMHHLQGEAGHDAGSRDALLDLFAGAATFWARAGLKSEALHWYRGLAPWRAAVTDVRRASRLALAGGMLAAFAQNLRPAEAIDALREANRHFEREGDLPRALLGLHLEHHLLMRMSRDGERAAVIARMRALVRPDWSRRMLAMIGWSEALDARDKGDYAAYRDFCEGERERALAEGDLAGAWNAAWGLGQALANLQELDAAIAVFDATVAEMRQLGRLREQATTVAMAATLRLRRGHDAAAVALAREAAQLLRGEGLLWWMADALALLPARQGRWEDALAVKAWANGVVDHLGERRGPNAQHLHDLFEGLRTRAGQPPPRAGASAPGDEEILRRCFP